MYKRNQFNESAEKIVDNVSYEIDGCKISVERIFDESRTLEDVIWQIIKQK